MSEGTQNPKAEKKKQLSQSELAEKVAELERETEKLKAEQGKPSDE